MWAAGRQHPTDASNCPFLTVLGCPEVCCTVAHFSAPRGLTLGTPCGWVGGWGGGGIRMASVTASGLPGTHCSNTLLGWCTQEWVVSPYNPHPPKKLSQLLPLGQGPPTPPTHTCCYRFIAAFLHRVHVCVREFPLQSVCVCVRADLFRRCTHPFSGISGMAWQWAQAFRPVTPPQGGGIHTPSCVAPGHRPALKPSSPGIASSWHSATLM